MTESLKHEKKKQSGWGGYREQAGRRPEGEAKKERTSITIDPEVLSWVRSTAHERGISVSGLLEQLARRGQMKQARDARRQVRRRRGSARSGEAGNDR